MPFGIRFVGRVIHDPGVPHPSVRDDKKEIRAVHILVGGEVLFSKYKYP
jgi:hypothetical protein